MKSTTIARLASRIERRRARRGQAGFTLLELLVVVAILAAIAGTATVALQDTDARASAAAHVAMMDELQKGIGNYRVLQRSLPNYFDSLVEDDTSNDTGTAIDGALYSHVAIEGDIEVHNLIPLAADQLSNGGMTHLMYVSTASDYAPEDDLGLNCSDTAELINSRSNAVVPGNIFLTPGGNGCGFPVALDASDASGDGITHDVAFWVGSYERVIGGAGREFDDAADVTGAPVLMTVGIGPSSTLFDGTRLGSLTSVPVYRHVSQEEYNRFIALFKIGTMTTNTTGYSDALANGNWRAIDQVNVVTVIDGAGDTKEEELGEWDGQRNTI